MASIENSFQVLHSLRVSEKRKKGGEPLKQREAEPPGRGSTWGEYFFRVLVKEDAMEFLIELMCHAAASTDTGKEYGIEDPPALSHYTRLIDFHGEDRIELRLEVGNTLRGIYRAACRGFRNPLSSVTLAEFLCLGIAKSVTFHKAPGEWHIFSNIPQTQAAIREAHRAAEKKPNARGEPPPFTVSLYLDKDRLVELLNRGLIEKRDSGDNP